MAEHRLDVMSLHFALDAVRSHRGLSWRAVAAEVGCSPSTLSRLQDGCRPDADTLLSLLTWLRMPADAFIAPATPDDADVVEALADLEHRQWAHWTGHMLEVLREVVGLGFYEARSLSPEPPGIAKAREALARWDRQIATPYADLSEAEKDSDREWARKARGVARG